jgi:hypothetical protein
MRAIARNICKDQLGFHRSTSDDLHHKSKATSVKDPARRARIAGRSAGRPRPAQTAFHFPIPKQQVQEGGKGRRSDDQGTLPGQHGEQPQAAGHETEGSQAQRNARQVAGDFIMGGRVGLIVTQAGKAAGQAAG